MNAQSINEKLRQTKQDKITIYPCRNLRASNLGHPCERYLQLLLTHWEDQIPHSIGLQNIFDLGNSLEDHTIKNLKEAGFEIITPTVRSWKIETPLITGREDLRLKEEDGQLYPVEIKGLEHREWESLNAIEDFFNSKKHYVRAYPIQLYCYMWKFEKEKGYFALTSKTTGETKFIEVKFDWAYVDSAFRKATRIYQAIDNNIELSPCEDSRVCENCSLQHICGNITRVGAEILASEELESLLNRREELKPYCKEFDEVDDDIKAIINNKEKVICGDWLVTTSKSLRKGYIVQESMSTRTSIKKIVA